MKRTALIIGGSSGLGLELARILRRDHQVVITGRKDPQERTLWFQTLELDGDSLAAGLDEFVQALPHIDLLVYAAGFYQEGTITDLSDTDIVKMDRVGVLAPAFLLRRLLLRQGGLTGFIAITSTSQWTPRLLEPMYTAVKAGLGMLSNSLSFDERVGKVLVVGPAGMRTHFWETDGRNTADMLDPAWVANETLHAWNGKFEYKFIRTLRNPRRVEIVAKR